MKKSVDKNTRLVTATFRWRAWRCLKAAATTLGLVAFFTANFLPVSAAPVKFEMPPETAKFKAGPGSEIAAAQCVICHSADYVSTQPRLSRAHWKASVQKMQQKYGAPIPEAQVEALVDYLVKNYGADMTKKTARP